MRVGQVTFFDATNYGAVVQAWALQRALFSMGADPSFVRFADDPTTVSPQQAQHASPLIRRLNREAQRRSEHFRGFVEHHLRVAGPYGSDAAETSRLDADFDLFLTGSDQVFNYQVNRGDARYLLSFADPAKRSAYAASFGLEELPENTLAWYREHLRHFRHMSVREESGIALYRELTGKDSVRCLDPTLLPSKEEFSAIAADGAHGGVFVYTIDYQPALIAEAEKIAAENGWPLRVACGGIYPQLLSLNAAALPVEEWVAAMRDADLVLTNSHHALALCIRFGTPYRLWLPDGALQKRNGRLFGLLALAGLSADARHGADWAAANARLEPMRQMSIRYLQNALEDSR